MGYEHFPETCPLCADMFNPATTLVSYDDCIKHLLSKVANLENRVQSIEWQSMPLASESPERKRFDHTAKVLGKQEPECAICFDEEGSWACLRSAHPASRKRSAQTE